MKLKFYLDRLLGNERGLQAHSRPEAEIMGLLAGRSVALVGNARALSDGTCGAQIEACDIVFRLKRAPIPSPVSHGVRTDWLATSMPITPELVAEKNPKVVLWLSRKRKRLPYFLARDPRFYLDDQAHALRLKARLGAPASLGALAIDLLVRSQAREIVLFGFDFFASNSLSTSRTADQVKHDFAAEARWVEGLMATDPRLRLVRPV